MILKNVIENVKQVLIIIKHNMSHSTFYWNLTESIFFFYSFFTSFCINRTT